MEAGNFQDPAEFLAAAQAAGVKTVILAWQDEWDLTDQRGFGPVQRGRLLAYDRGRLLACAVSGQPCAAVAGRVRDAGFQIELRSRNLS